MKSIIITYKRTHGLREKTLLWLLGFVIPIHAKIYSRRKPWGLKREDLLQCSPGTLGREMGLFLEEGNLQPVPRVERHDAYHVLLDYTLEVKQEAAMQFFLVGNGKYSPFTVGTAIFAGLMLPEEWNYFKQEFIRGKQARSMARWNFRYLLDDSYADLCNIIFRKKVSNDALLEKIASMENGCLKAA